MQSNLSAKISRSDSYTKIPNYSSLRGIITKWIDMRYITFMQKHLASIQSQRDWKGIAKSISNSLVYFSKYFYIRMIFFCNSFTPERIIYEFVLTFESADEIRWCDHLNETSLAVLLRCTICFSEFYRIKFGISVHLRLWPFLWVKELKQPL